MEYICVCGKIFNSSQSINAHKKSCKEYLGEDRYNEIQKKQKSSYEKISNKLKENGKIKKEEKLNQIRVCEKCEKEYCWKNTYPFCSKRFCSKFCSHSFSANKNREVKISKLMQTLSQKGVGVKKIYFCKHCGKEIISSKQRKYCSVECSNKEGLTKGKTWKCKDSSKMGGVREKGGKIKKYITYINRLNEKMVLNQEEVIVAQYLDRLNLKWHRNWTGFFYIDLNGKNRNFYPDFYIEDYDLYVEYKGWIDKKNLHKMTSAMKNNSFKLKIIYSNNKRYKDLGTNLDDIKTTTNNLLFD